MTGRTARIVAVVVSSGAAAEDVGRRWGFLDGCVVVEPGARSVVHRDADWILLVGDDESMQPGSAPVLRDAIGRAGERVIAVPLVTRGLGMELAARRPVVRLAPAGTPVVFANGCEMAFDPGGREVARVAVVLTRERGETLGDAMDWLGRTGGTLAALAEDAARSDAAVMIDAAIAGLRTLAARSRSGRLGLGRLVLAVLDAYRVVVVYAKRWERRRDRVVDFG